MLRLSVAGSLMKPMIYYRTRISIEVAMISASLLVGCAVLGTSQNSRDASPTSGYHEEAEETAMMPERSKRSQMDADEAAPEPEDKPRERMVIYEAEMQSSVNEIEPAMEKTIQIIKGFQGYIEKQQIDKESTRAFLIIRVPVDRFTETLDALAKVGEVQSRSIKADDITDQFADLSQRLENRKQLLNRLYAILKKTTDTEQKIRILNEIARLNKEVESMQARKDYLAKKAAFSTIRFTLQAQAKTTVNQGSVIPWIRGLRPDRRTLNAAPAFEFPMPEGFLDYSEDYGSSGDYIYASPDGVQIRAATIDNNPKADAAYYEKALLYERGRYPEKVLSSKHSGNRVELTTPQQVGYNKAYYTIALFVDGQTLHVIEVFYPGEEVFNKQRKAVEKSIEIIEPSSGIMRFLEDLI